jgi:hypothetical protein
MPTAVLAHIVLFNILDTGKYQRMFPFAAIGASKECEHLSKGEK